MLNYRQTREENNLDDYFRVKTEVRRKIRKANEREERWLQENKID